MTTEYDRMVAEQASSLNENENDPENFDTDHGLSDTDEDVDVDTDFSAEDDEVEDVTDAPADATSTATKAKKEPAKPKRGDLPEGFVTPVGLAKVITEQGLHGKDNDGTPRVCPPQVVYSYIKNAPKEHPFPLETVNDSIGNPRQALKLDAGIEWWKAKNARVAERKTNAAQKLEKKEAAAAAKEAAGTTEAASEPETPAEEAE
jgi:hypothetical protein